MAQDELLKDLRRRMDGMAHKLLETLQATANVLEVEDVPGQQEFSGVVREMPAFDPGQLALSLRRPFYLSMLGDNLSRSLIAKRLTDLSGQQLTKALSAYRALLYDWSDRTLGQIQRGFDAYANSYRAQVERLVGDHPRAGQEGAIQRDLEDLGSARPEQAVAP